MSSTPTCLPSAPAKFDSTPTLSTQSSQYSDRRICQLCNLEIFCSARAYNASITYCVCPTVSCQCEACNLQSPITSVPSTAVAVATAAAKKARRQRRRAHNKEKVQQAKANLEAATSSTTPSAPVQVSSLSTGPTDAPAQVPSISTGPIGAPAIERTCNLVKRGRRIIDLANQLFISAELAVHKETIEMLSMRAIKTVHRQLGAVIKDHNLARRQEKRQGRLKLRKQKRQQQHNKQHNKQVPSKDKKKKKGQKKALKLSDHAAITKRKRKVQHQQHKESQQASVQPAISASTSVTSALNPLRPLNQAQHSGIPSNRHPDLPNTHRSSAQPTSHRSAPPSNSRLSTPSLSGIPSNRHHQLSSSHHPSAQPSIHLNPAPNLSRLPNQVQHSGTSSNWRSAASSNHPPYAQSSPQRGGSAHQKPPASRGITKQCNYHRLGNCWHGKHCRYQH
jgi:hypothetical protein